MKTVEGIYYNSFCFFVIYNNTINLFNLTYKESIPVIRTKKSYWTVRVPFMNG